MVDTSFQGFPTTVQQSVQFLDPYSKAQQVQLMEEARRVALERVEIPKQEVAEFTPDQEKAFRLSRQGVGAYQPLLTQAGSVDAQGNLTGLYGQAAGQYGAVGAPGVRGTGQVGAIEEGLDLTRRGIAPTTEGLAAIEGLKTGSQAYQSPFQQAVIDEGLREINRQSDIDAQKIGAQAANVGAFGGSRQGVLEAEHLRNTQSRRNQFIAQMNLQKYNQAQKMGLDAASAYNVAGKQYGQIGGQLATIGGGFGTVAQGQANIAEGVGALGQAGAQLGMQDINVLSQQGAVQRAADQAREDVKYQRQLQKEYEPYQRVSFVSDILRGTPSGGQTLSVSAAPLPNPFTQALGTGLATAGLFAPRRN